MDDVSMCREKGLQRRLKVTVVWSESSAGDMSSLGPPPSKEFQFLKCQVDLSQVCNLLCSSLYHSDVKKKNLIRC